MDKRCDMCGMDVTRSKGRFVCDLKDGTRIDACSASCAARILSEHGSDLYRISVFGYDTGALINGFEAVYVIGAGGFPEGSMPPGVYAFSTREGAGRLVAEKGGRTATLNEVLTYVMQAGKQGGGRH